MQILVDADACPVVIRDILYRAAQKRELKLTLFANQSFQVPASPLISLYQVAKGPDMADHEIAARVEEGDLVITADIPLASEVLEKGALVITPRGERYTQNNIRQRLQMRDNPQIFVFLPVPPSLASDRVIHFLQIGNAEFNPA